jgi:hypothetical protein
MAQTWGGGGGGLLVDEGIIHSFLVHGKKEGSCWISSSVEIRRLQGEIGMSWIES